MAYADIELEGFISTTGGIFSAEDGKLYEEVAGLFTARGEQVSVEKRGEDLKGHLLDKDKIRLIIKSSGNIERFWDVADPAKKFRKDLIKQGVTGEALEQRVSGSIIEAVDKLFSTQDQPVRRPL
jgi:hypothetical protein